MSFKLFIATLCFAMPFLGLHVNAAALRRDVFDPPITYPTQGTLWHVGEIHNVTWDTSILPPNFSQTGMIVLGFLNDTANDGNEHLDLDNPLATGFPLAAGSVNITVPAVPPMDSYILILFGDSGNASPQFTITNLSIGTPPSSSPAIPSATTLVSESAPTSTSASSLVGGSSSITEASSPAGVTSSIATPSSNPAANNNSPAPLSGSSTTAPVIPTSHISTASSIVPSSSGPSPSTSAGGTTNGITAPNSAQAKSISFSLLSLSAATTVFLSWGL